MNNLARFKLKPIACIFASFGLAACGGTGQDTGQVSSLTEHAYSGTAIDGHLARARVYFDYDNNGTRSPWEPFALTDNDGHYSYNPDTDTDYCADLSADTAIFCLQNSRQDENVMIRVEGGYDVVTGEPFKGQLSRRVNTATGGSVTGTVISPMTTVVSSAETEQDKQTLLLALGIDEADLDVDYLNSDGNGGVDAGLFNTAVKLHKINNLLADSVEDHYSEVFSEPGLPSDMSASAYRNLGYQMLASRANLEQAVSNKAFISSVLQSVEMDARELYRRRDLPLPNNGSDLVDRGHISNRAANMAQVIDTLLPANMPIDAANVRGRTRTIEALTLKNLKDNSGQDTSVETAVAFFTNDNNRSHAQTVIDALGQRDADLNALARNDFVSTDFTSVEAVNAAVRLPADAVAFSQLAGLKLRIADMNLGFGPNNLDDSEVEAYFMGEPDATEGRLIACVKHIDDASSDGTLGEASIRGERVSGHWSLLNPDASDGSSYDVVLTLKFLGATYQAIMKSAGTNVIDGNTMQTIRFDYAGEIRSWHSAVGLQPQTIVPATNKECEVSLPSRIGL